MAKNPVIAVGIALAALYVACLALNFEQPLVRNALVYARASEHVIEHGFDPLPVVADSRLSYDKPIGFAWLGAPLVAAFGTHRGLMLASCAGTLAYLLALVYFARSFALSSAERATLMLFAGISPIVAYQSWSAHPDSLFAALYLVAAGLSIRIVERASFARSAGLFATFVGSLLLKNYGLIVAPSCALYLAWNQRRLRAQAMRGELAALALAFVTIAGLATLAKLGLNPLMRIEGEGGGAGQYGRGVLWVSSKGTWLQIGLTLLLCLHVALPAAARARGWRASDAGPGLSSLFACFVAPYVLGLMPFPTTFYNARYFVPLLPFVALLAVLGLRASSGLSRRLVPPTFALVALSLTAVFNVAPLHAALEQRIPRLEVDWIGVPLSFLDNLRMPMHREQAAVLEHLNAQIEPGAVVYMLDVDYYGDAQRGVYERAGLIRGDIDTRYVKSRELVPTEPRFYLFGRMRDRARIEALGRVTELGRGLYRVQR